MSDGNQHLNTLIQRGSATAKAGFKNEAEVVDKFNNWWSDVDAQAWLKLMNYELTRIQKVEASLVPGHHKADVEVKITLQSFEVVTELVSIKLVSNPQGFNQIDKRWVSKYVEVWNIPDSIAKLLKQFTGEISPLRSDLRDKRRMFLDELSVDDQQKVVSFFEIHKIQVISDVLKGRDEYSANWMLIYQKKENVWSFLPMPAILDFYSQGAVTISKQGSLKIGKLTMQRKGGDGGRSTANMLQFKFNPCEVVKKTTTL